MKNAGFYRKVQKLATVFECKLKDKYKNALVNGKESFMLTVNTQLEHEIVQKICRLLKYETNDFVGPGFKTLVQISKEDIRFKNKLFKTLHSKLVEAAIYGDNYIVIEESQFSIVASQPLLEVLGFKCEECGNEIWRVSF